MQIQPIVIDDGKILTDEILKTNNKVIFDPRFKSALLKKISRELSKIVKGISVLIKNARDRANTKKRPLI
jgi:hypothetical protein